MPAVGGAPQEDRGDRHEQPLQRVGHTHRPEAAEQRVNEHDAGADEHRGAHLQAESRGKGMAGRLELGSHVEGE
jgi:hypothetical protein